ncbi:MFS transporter, partial [Streptomyces sp. NPDC059447]|uniref:MFS transporter n=1 Tax=Streptomyces sp. NPDC059447 TaxID=3346834 RepID=UPI0036A212B9
MYLADRSAPADGAKTAPGTGPGRTPAVASTVLALGAVSLITDISSEMVTAVLPLYLIAGLGLSPLGFGALDGVYNGVSALIQLTGGHLADRVRNHKLIAGLGYGLSALCKPLLLLAHSAGPIGVVLALERTGKGLRTAPRDALISLSTPAGQQGRAFGVHRAMDTTGALLGPLAAFFILSAAVGGYDAVFGVSACVAALGVVVLILFVPGRGPQPDPRPPLPAGPGPADGAVGQGRPGQTSRPGATPANGRPAGPARTKSGTAGADPAAGDAAQALPTQVRRAGGAPAASPPAGGPARARRPR